MDRFIISAFEEGIDLKLDDQTEVLSSARLIISKYQQMGWESSQEHYGL
ncbi:hypothetical protein [Clostridium thermarum]|nr:hypothetical protein [Clostridium thermarum]